MEDHFCKLIRLSVLLQIFRTFFVCFLFWLHQCLRRSYDPHKHKMAEESKLLGVLNVKVIGSGKPTLVLAHGFGPDQSVWQYILPYVVAHYKVIVFNMVSSGKVDPKNFDFDRYTSLSVWPIFSPFWMS